MILVDSRVWIDFFRGDENAHTQQLAAWLVQPEVEVLVADLVLFEVLRGFGQSRAFQAAYDFLLELPSVDIGGMDNARQAAAHDRSLRAKGFTRKNPIDVLLARYCITHGHTLLHRDVDVDVDVDVDAMQTLRGLQSEH